MAEWEAEVLQIAQKGIEMLERGEPGMCDCRPLGAIAL